MKTRTVNLQLISVDAQAIWDGGMCLEILGTTPGGEVVKVKVQCSTAAVGSVGSAMHAVIKQKQATLDRARANLRGEEDK